MKKNLRIPLFIVIYSTYFNNAHSQTIASGISHCTSVCSEKYVKTWGTNRKGCLGDSTYSRNYPVVIEDNHRVISVGSGNFFSMFLTADSTLYSWGANNNGQQGDSSHIDSYSPKQITRISSVAKYSAGSYHFFALKGNGDVYAWGRNTSGQFGNGTIDSSSVPLMINTISNLWNVAAGENHTLFLKSDSTVWACGSNAQGQLGTGNLTHSQVPVKVNNLSGIIAISAGNSHSIALKSDGTVWFWGSLYHVPAILQTPVQVTNLSNIIAIDATKGTHCLALKSDGTVWAWGTTLYGEMGANGNTTQSGDPHGYYGTNAIQVVGLSNVVEISGGLHSTYAVKNDQSIWAVGFNYFDQLGDSSTVFNSTMPVKVVGSGNCNYLNSMNELDINYSLSVFPNPTSGVFSVSMQNINVSIVSVYNSLGEKLFDKKLNTDDTIIDLSKYSKGIYFISALSDNNAQKFRKIIVE
jgi:alpha-tubulin suppressor-like RCC1 family protein